ncbi:MAG: 4-alpha-glucanotransferase, partial [Tissierellia bacterium]|nr:4-alpha-glucanotransferase [Tissierellia bacterium]
SVSRIAILQMQDLLLLDNSARMNIPGTLGDNWTWRMEEKNLNEDVILKLKDLTEMSGRL